MDFDVFYKVFHLLILIVSASLLLVTIKKNQEWNRRKTTHEVINELVFGDYTELSRKLTNDLNIKVHDIKNDYLKSLDALSEEQKEELKLTAKKIFNLFEVLSISIKNGIVDEDICYDYLGMMYSEYYRWGIDFIEELRQEYNEKRVLINFQNCAVKWKQRRDNEVIIKNVKGKGNL
jgi:hypothetical protein